MCPARARGARGSVPEDISLAAFAARCDEYIEDDGCVIDQPFQARLPDGMIRCYMGGDGVLGFGHQLIKALIAPPSEPGPRIMYPASAPQFQRLRQLMEGDWTPRLLKGSRSTGNGCRSSGTPTFFTVRGQGLARTPTCCARSM